MLSEVSRWLIAVGSVAAAVGLVVFGMGVSYIEPRDFEVTVGTVLMAGGILATVIGIIIYRATGEPETEAPPRRSSR